MNSKTTLIEFDESLITGIEEMDEEHKKLIEMLNTVYDILKRGEKDEAHHYFDKEILSYVKTHLKDEEEFMEKINCPELEQHKKIHEIFRKMITDLIPSIESGDHKAFSQALPIS